MPSEPGSQSISHDYLVPDAALFVTDNAQAVRQLRRYKWSDRLGHELTKNRD
jgi:hypothetical protein